LFFTDDASGIAVIDFQLLRRGGPVAALQDVAYLLIISTRMRVVSGTGTCDTATDRASLRAI
jgi:hypothetical protein